ncbi:DNA gyrase subunit A [Microcystis aeruginosa NIES-2481]|nr:DNA gyrase subunit A [Microcystis aeruginosa NIES-2481]
MKKFSPPQMKEGSFPTPHTLHPTPSFKSAIRVKFTLDSQANLSLFGVPSRQVLTRKFIG